MSTGIYDSANTTYYTPDKALSKTSSPRVLTAKFGDGYEQRIADGINSIAETFSLTYNNREKAYIDDLVVFLDSTKAVTSFNFVLPDTNAGGGTKTIKTVCQDYNTVYQYDNYYKLTVTLRRVYEP